MMRRDLLLLITLIDLRSMGFQVPTGRKFQLTRGYVVPDTNTVKDAADFLNSYPTITGVVVGLGIAVQAFNWNEMKGVRQFVLSETKETKKDIQKKVEYFKLQNDHSIQTIKTEVSSEIESWRRQNEKCIESIMTELQKLNDKCDTQALNSEELKVSLAKIQAEMSLMKPIVLNSLSVQQHEKVADEPIAISHLNTEEVQALRHLLSQASSLPPSDTYLAD